MSSDSFGKIFKITTFGESHGPAIGVVIEGCPSGLQISLDEINLALKLRAPGKNPLTTPRQESDEAEILSGFFDGKTTGAPICLLIKNQDANSSHYEAIKDILRPGHANFTYLEKYGIFDYRGGGRASARETAARVAAGAIAEKILHHYHIHLYSYVKQIGTIEAKIVDPHAEDLNNEIFNSPVYCPDKKATEEIVSLIDRMKKEGDSVGGIVEFLATGVPTGLGNPIYEKIEAQLASAMMSIPATKGFEIGSGFQSVLMKGSEHNDRFKNLNGKIETETNHSGGILGGISNGMPIIGRVAFKPTSSIQVNQSSLTTTFQETTFKIPKGSRHDPCVAIRGVVVVKAMLALVLVDLILLNRCSRL